MGMVRNALRWMRQGLCAHSFSISQIRRTSPSSVCCTCTRCGKTLTAPYGIALPGRIER